MRYKGYNILAIAVAAIAIYVLEFLIFAVAISPEQYMTWTGLSEGQGDVGRMPFGILPPILAAIGIALVIKWRAQPGMGAGAWAGVLMAILFALPGALYPFVYGAHEAAYVPVNFLHFVVCYAAAGAIIGAWK